MSETDDGVRYVRDTDGNLNKLITDENGESVLIQLSQEEANAVMQRPSPPLVASQTLGYVPFSQSTAQAPTTYYGVNSHTHRTEKIAYKGPHSLCPICSRQGHAAGISALPDNVLELLRDGITAEIAVRGDQYKPMPAADLDFELFWQLRKTT